MNDVKKKLDLSLIVFQATLLALVFLLGSGLALLDIHPFRFLSDGYNATKTLALEQAQTGPPLLSPRVHNKIGVTVHDPAQAYQGLTVLQGWFKDGAQVRLVDMDGRVVHKWEVDFFEIWPDPKHLPEQLVPKTRLNFHSQGLVTLPDGSVVVNLSNVGAAKLDKCGDVIWTVDKKTHHSVTRVGDEGFWMPSSRDTNEVADDLLIRGISKKYLEKTLGRYENLLLLVDANGKVQREISVLKALFEADFEPQLFDAKAIQKGDPTHVNDIEVVTAALAQKIDGVEEGDLLVSIRQMHMLAIFDQQTGRIKWHQTGPWVRQHDPDISPQGNILVFNNRPHLGNELRSNLIEFDPATGISKVIYPRDDKTNFYTDIMGTQQVLPNGNILINESRRGRVFEINQDGEIVWEYVQAFDRDRAALIEMAERFDPSYFTVKDWNCD